LIHNHRLPVSVQGDRKETMGRARGLKLIFTIDLQSLRDFCLGINYIEIAIELEIFVFFLRGYRQTKAEGGIPGRNTLMAALGFLLAAFSRGFYIQLDYYAPEPLYQYLAWFFLILSITLVLFALFNGTGKLAFSRFRFRMQFVILGITFAIFLMIVRLYVDDLMFWIIVNIAGLALMAPLILQFLRWVNQVGGYIRRNFRIAACGVPLIYSGIAIGPLWTYLPTIEGWITKIIGHLTFITGLCMVAIALLSLPTWSEFDWEEKVERLLVLLQSGILVYEYNFQGEEEFDSDLVGCGLSGVVSLVKEMTGSEKGIKVIRQDQKIIYLEYGEHVTVVIIASEELRILYEKIANFTREFEILFTNILGDWNGSTSEFQLAESLVKKNFLSTQ